MKGFILPNQISKPSMYDISKCYANKGWYLQQVMSYFI